MKQYLIPIFAFCFLTINALAQTTEDSAPVLPTPLSQPVEGEEDFVKTGFLIGFGAMPTTTGGDMKDRFGTILQIGPSIMYKTSNNWLTGVSYNVMLGRKINEPVGGNLLNAQGYIIGTDGYIAGIEPTMRGYNVQYKLGKILNFNSKNLDSGILLMAGVGFLQHKIHFKNRFDNTPQISGDYKKGYDKLTNGVMLSQTFAFFKLDKKRLFNYQVGIELSEGFTKNRRAYNFDIQSADNKQRFDFMAALKFTIYIPAYVSAKDEYYYK